MKILMFEGTPQEMKELKGFGLFNFREPSIDSDGKDSSEVQEQGTELTQDVVINALTRSGGLTPTQRNVIKAIHSDGKNGIPSSELAKVTGLPPSEVKASMRSLGRRIAHTPGWPTGIKVFAQVWTGMQNIYRLHPIMRNVIDRGLVKL